jgi:GNAT superfamily N-acetyltransferase
LVKTGPASAPSGLAVELATSDDRGEVLRLLAGQFDELQIPVPEPRLAEAVDGVFADPRRGFFLLGRLGGRPVGLAYMSHQWTLEHGGGIVWLEELFVEPGMRSRGLGRELLRAACDHARAQGCRAVDLEVETTHPRASGLYLREGFRPLERRRLYRLLP